MNFPNFAYHFFSYPCYYDALYRYPFMNQMTAQGSPVNYTQVPAETMTLVKDQHVLKMVNKKTLIENLKTFHEDEVHRKKTHWTQQQDKLLEKLVEVQKLEWKEIPSFFKQRSQNMCYSRYRRISMGTKDRNWTREEQQKLIDLINRYGERWKLLSSKMPKFTPKQIRERYLNYLRPNIIKDQFTMQEDLKICQYVIRNGKHWRKMEQIIEGRSQGAIKGRYYSKLYKIIESSLDQQNK